MTANNGSVLAPLPVAPVNETDMVLFPKGLKALQQVAKEVGLDLRGAYVNLDGGFDSRANRQCIFNAGMIPNIKENPRNRKTPKRGCKRLFNAAIHALRMRVERTFAWEEKFKRLLLRFEHIQQRQKLGRPRVAEEIEQLVVRMAEENATWGYRRIQGALANLGYPIDAITVRNILRRHHLEPAPQRRKAGMGWAQFLTLHWEVLAATDFFTAEVATWHGMVTYYVLFVMDLATRRVQIAGITPHPTAAFMEQCARQLADPFDSFLLGKQYLLHDRDTKFTQAFDALLQGRGVAPLLLPPRSPNLNAHCERFVRSIKEEALEQMVMLGERSLHYAIQQYLIHYHTERNHQGLGNRLLAPEPSAGRSTGQVIRRGRLSGLLSYYHREAA